MGSGPPEDSQYFYNKWIFKTKTDAIYNVERYKARLDACGNKYQFGINYTLTFVAIKNLESVKVNFGAIASVDSPSTSC